MMNGQDSPIDWEELSAYLDEQLSTKEKERFENRLRNNPQLLLALNELKELRALLRAQPMIRAPRNYLLSADLEGVKIKRRQRGFIFPALSFAAAVASLLFVIVFVSDLTYGGPQVSQTINISEERLEIQVMEKALSESAVSDEVGGDIGEAQAVPMEPVEDELKAMREFTEESDIPQLESLDGQPESRVETHVSEGGEKLQRIQPDLVQYIISNRKAMRILEIILIVVAFTAGLGAFYVYRKRD